MATTALLLAIEIMPEDNLSTTVDGAMSEKDAGGYMYVDSNDPDPKVEFDWIDAANNPRSELLEEVKYYYTTNVFQFYDLPFSFPFYDGYYDECAVVCGGYLDFGGWQYSSIPGYYYFYGTNWPMTTYERGVVAAWAYAIGGYSSYPTINFGVYALQGETYGERWVCFEWYKALAPGSYGGQPNPEQYEITFEIILYESGLIKMQYLDADTAYAAYSNGGYAVGGIMDVTGTKGVAHCKYSDTTLKSGLAVMYGKNIGEVGAVTVETEDGGAMYSMHRDYSITAEVKHPINNDMIKIVAISLGNNLADLVYYQNTDGSHFFSKIDASGFITVNAGASSSKTSGDFLEVTFKFSPTFAYPVTTPQGLKISVLGAGVMPGSTKIPDAFWVENRLQMIGSMVGVSDVAGIVENGGWIKGGVDFNFRGVKAVYPGTEKSPMPGSHTYTITDEVGNKFFQPYVTDFADVLVTSENDLVVKKYQFNITDVPPGTDISDPLIFTMNIDPYRPTPPKEILIHADSFDDRNTEYDDDNEVFVTWEPSEDFESGIRGYYVSTFDPFLAGTDPDEAIFVRNPDTSTKLTFPDMGTRKVYVWAMDKAGNPSIPSFAVTKIDATEVIFSEFSPGNQVWVNTRTPICSVLIDDSGGSGVSAKSLEYAISTTNTLEFGAWQASVLGRDNEQIRLSVQGLFENGKDNYIRFRAKDVAGNGWTYSQDYNVWIDEERPSFTNFRPFESEFQNSKNVVVSADITDIHALREGSGIQLDTVEYRVSSQGLGQFGDWETAPISSIDDNGVVHVEMELDLREGSQNYVQFRCYDNVGNFALSKEFNVKVNAAPVLDAFLSAPKNGHTYTTSEKILFDSSRTVDPDGDSLGFSWYSDINGFLSSDDSFFRALSPGVHLITLVVNDPAHSIVKSWEIEVLEETQIDPEDMDSDGDGIYDAWEIRYGLDPNRPDSFIDTDNDKFTNLQEFQNGTDPTRSISHPPYPSISVKGDGGDDTEDQYRNITLALVLVSLLVVLILCLLAYTRHKNFMMERDEEKELETEEMTYRRSLDKEMK
jgi:hypothetical protein